MLTALQNPDVWQFLTLMMAVSLIAFAIAVWRKLDLFNSPAGLGLLLVIVWSPNIAAVVMTARQGRLGSWFTEATAWTTNPWVWLLALSPLIVVVATWLWRGRPATDVLDGRSMIMLFVINLMLGPLGEEFGLRGYLLPLFLQAMDFAQATLLLGVLWAVWHLPLWFVDSPQRKIPFAIFFASVLCFSVILGRIYQLGGGSIWPVVLFHFVVNYAVGFAEATGRFAENASYRLLLPGYAVVAGCVLWSQLY